MAKTKKTDIEKKAPEAAPEAAQEASPEALPALAPEVAEVKGLCIECGQNPDACGGAHIEVLFMQDVGINGRMFAAGTKGFLPVNALGAFAHAVKQLK